MLVLDGPVVVLDGADCAVVARQLVESIRLAYTSRGTAPPHALLAFADRVSTAARGSAQFRRETEAGGTGGTGGFRDGVFLRTSGKPVTLTAAEAARAAEVSAGYMRRLIRRGDVEASQDRRGAYRVRADSLAAWLSGRRDERATEAA